MFASDITDYGYEAGRFKLGQTIYHLTIKTHRFRFHKQCVFCDSTGQVLIKGKEFKCPNCRGDIECKEVDEKIIDDTYGPIKIASVMTFKNNDQALEIYTNDSSGYGLIIQKSRNGENNYFATREEAQQSCDEYNKKYCVYTLLDEYKRREIMERA